MSSWEVDLGDYLEVSPLFRYKTKKEYIDMFGEEAYRTRDWAWGHTLDSDLDFQGCPCWDGAGDW